MARSSAVIRPQGVARFVASSLFMRRTACGIIGDSNVAQATLTGHADGMRRGASWTLGCYGTGVSPAAPTVGDYQSGVLETDCAGAVGMTGAPSEFSNLCFTGGLGGPEAGDYFASGWPAASTLGFLKIKSTHPMDINRSIEFHTRLWRPADGGADQFAPSIIVGGVGSVLYPASAETADLPPRSASGVDNFVYTVPEGALVNYANPADPLGTGAEFGYREQRWSGAGGSDIPGTFGLLYRQAVDPGMHRGVIYSRLTGNGGVSTRVPAANLCNTYRDEAIAEWFRAHADVQLDRFRNRLAPMMMIQIIEGGNDAGDATSSVVFRRGAARGSATTSGNPASNTRAGFRNNLQSIINRLLTVWTQVCGYDERDLFFLLGPYHAQPTGTQFTFFNDVGLLALQDVVNNNENCTFIDGYRLKTHEEFNTAHSYSTTASPYTAVVTVPWHRAPGSDNAHLNQVGYRDFGLIGFAALRDACLDMVSATPVIRGEISLVQGGASLFRVG